jgi:hypothetical protein
MPRTPSSVNPTNVPAIAPWLLAWSTPPNARPRSSARAVSATMALAASHVNADAAPCAVRAITMLHTLPDQANANMVTAYPASPASSTGRRP